MGPRPHTWNCQYFFFKKIYFTVFLTKGKAKVYQTPIDIQKTSSSVNNIADNVNNYSNIWL